MGICLWCFFLGQTQKKLKGIRFVLFILYHNTYHTEPISIPALISTFFPLTHLMKRLLLICILGLSALLASCDNSENEIAKAPEFIFSLPDTGPVRGKILLSVTPKGSDKITKVQFQSGETIFGIVDKAPFQLELDTRALQEEYGAPDGRYSVSATAYNGDLQTTVDSALTFDNYIYQVGVEPGSYSGKPEGVDRYEQWVFVTDKSGNAQSGIKLPEDAWTPILYPDNATGTDYTLHLFTIIQESGEEGNATVLSVNSMPDQPKDGDGEYVVLYNPWGGEEGTSKSTSYIGIKGLNLQTEDLAIHTMAEVSDVAREGDSVLYTVKDLFTAPIPVYMTLHPNKDWNLAAPTHYTEASLGIGDKNLYGRDRLRAFQDQASFPMPAGLQMQGGQVVVYKQGFTADATYVLQLGEQWVKNGQYMLPLEKTLGAAYISALYYAQGSQTSYLYQRYSALPTTLPTDNVSMNIGSAQLSNLSYSFSGTANGYSLTLDNESGSESNKVFCSWTIEGIPGGSKAYKFALPDNVRTAAQGLWTNSLKPVGYQLTKSMESVNIPGIGTINNQLVKSVSLSSNGRYKAAPMVKAKPAALPNQRKLQALPKPQGRLLPAL